MKEYHLAHVSDAMARLGKLLGQKFPNKRRKVYIRGDLVLDAPRSISEVVVVDSGYVGLAWAEDITSIERGAQVLGLDAALSGRETELTATARSQVIGFSLSRDELVRAISTDGQLAIAVTEALAEMAAIRQSKLERTVNYSNTYLESPGARILPGKIVYEEFPIYYFFLRADPEELAAMLPPGLSPLPVGGGFYVFTVSLFSGERTAADGDDVLALCYHEVAPSIPCIGPGGVGLFTNEFYVDCSFAVALGRELYGYPKVFGFSNVSERCLEVTRGDALVFDARWRGTHQIGDFGVFELLAKQLFQDDHGFAEVADALEGIVGTTQLFERLLPLSSTVKTWTRKRLLRANASGPDEDRVDELVEVPFVGSDYCNLEWLEGLEVEMPVSIAALPGECVGAIRFNVHIEVGTPSVITDYLEP